MTTSKNDGSKYLTRQQAADYLGVSVAALARWASRRYGPAYYRLGRDVRYYVYDLDDFVEQQRRPSVQSIAMTEAEEVKGEAQ